MLLTNNDVYKRDRQTCNFKSYQAQMVYKRDRQTCTFKAIKHRWCTRETDKHVILKLSSTDGVQERQTNM